MQKVGEAVVVEALTSVGLVGFVDFVATVGPADLNKSLQKFVAESHGAMVTLYRQYERQMPLINGWFWACGEVWISEEKYIPVVTPHK